MADFKYGELTEKITGGAYNPEIGLLLNFGSKRLEFHRFTNKQFNPQVIHHLKTSINPINPSSDK